jgi:alcohol dehydrogenase
MGGAGGYFEFGCGVRLLAGDHRLEAIADILLPMGVGRPMVVTDPGVEGAGLTELLSRSMGKRLPIAVTAADVPPDSPLESVEAIARRYRESSCDALIALGGGSVIDTAKAVNVLVSENDESLMPYVGVGRIRHSLKPFVAVPTTAGTGSEMTTVSVIKDSGRGLKLFLVSRFLLPHAAVLDPRVTVGLPADVTAGTAMDALTHAIEAYTCLAKNPLSDAAAWQAVELIGRHLLPLMSAPQDHRKRLRMALAASLAGAAFSNSMVGMVHALGHAVGSLCHVPHGSCMAVFLPYGLETNLPAIAAPLSELLIPLAGTDLWATTPPDHRPKAVIDRIRWINDKLHRLTQGRHPRCLSDLVDDEGTPLVSRNRFTEIAGAAVNDGSLLWNPKDVSREAFEQILEAAWDGRTLS